MNDYCLKADEEGRDPTCLEIFGAMGRYCEVCAAIVIERLKAEIDRIGNQHASRFADYGVEVVYLKNRLRGATTLAGLRQMTIDLLEAEVENLQFELNASFERLDVKNAEILQLKYLLGGLD